MALHPDLPLRVVTLGGGTGLAALLRALKSEAERPDQPWQLTGIVTVSDNGGSSGRLREELGGIPPGDLRNCLSALTRQESILSDLLSYRFKGEGSLAGHSLGNLMLLAMVDITGDWVKAIRELSGVLVTAGRLFPSTTVPVTLCATDAEGRSYVGETAVNETKAPIRSIWLEPEAPEPLPEAMLAILRADLILLAPGSLYTSTLPNLLIPELRRALQQTNAPILYVANLMTEAGETSGLDLEGHLRAILDIGGVRPTAVLVNDSLPSPEVMARYREEGGAPILPSGPETAGIPVTARPLLDLDASAARHHPSKVLKAVREMITNY
ncbi:MAG: uridine diphosphate-N-acetylglucosamine-binding protein YvcK [Holophagaceae bacterium]|nr:uridine diphosphate-N-acetylglucosamine-binding protein YvcK [Holophagaceae bacterium]